MYIFISKPLIIILFIIFFHFNVFCLAEDTGLKGKLIADGINVRTDSTVSAESICKVNKDDVVDIIKEMYDWYKIRLPKNAPSFIRKDMVELIDNKKAKVIKTKVNIRLGPNESSSIIGRVELNDTVNILEDLGRWYRIEPVNTSYGWINKKFVVLKEQEDTKPKQESTPEQLTQELEGRKTEITVEGIIKSKFFTRLATHKLVTADNRVFLLDGNREELNALVKHRVRITGKILTSYNQQDYTIIQVERIEPLD